MSERNYPLKVTCVMCHKTITLMVRVEDYFTFDMPNRPYIQDIFPYLSPEERELLLSGICGDCFHSMFDSIDSDEDEDCDYDEEDCENE